MRSLARWTCVILLIGWAIFLLVPFFAGLTSWAALLSALLALVTASALSLTGAEQEKEGA